MTSDSGSHADSPGQKSGWQRRLIKRCPGLFSSAWQPVRVKVRIKFRWPKAHIALRAMPDTQAARETEISLLHAEIAVLYEQVRSGSDLVRWRPNLFYYLFSVVAGLTASSLTSGQWLGPRSLTVMGLCLGLLCGAPAAVNQLRDWVRIRRPNRRLKRRIASLQAQIEWLQGGE